MLFVLLSHFTNCYFNGNDAQSLRTLLLYAGKLATPTFMMISGIMLGFLYGTHGETFDSITAKLRQRGLFYLTLGHVLIAGAFVLWVHSYGRALLRVQITDTIGICIITGPLLITFMSPRTRILTAIALYSLSTLLSLFWNPHFTLFNYIKIASVGSLAPLSESAGEVYTFPIVPWFAFYLASSVMGEKLAQALHSEKHVRSYGFFWRVSLVIGIPAVIMSAPFVIAHPANAQGSRGGFTDLLITSLYHKSPPGLIYLMSFGSIGLLIIYFLSKIENIALFRPYLHFAATLGKTSFFVFVLQFYVYFCFFYLMRLHYTLLWPFYFLFSTGLIWLAARYWERKGYTRCLLLPRLPHLFLMPIRSPIDMHTARGKTNTSPMTRPAPANSCVGIPKSQ